MKQYPIKFKFFYYDKDNPNFFVDSLQCPERPAKLLLINGCMINFAHWCKLLGGLLVAIALAAVLIMIF